MKAETSPLIVGVPGLRLSASEFEVLDRVRPAGIILFARNVASADQVRDLVASFGELEKRPFVAVDLEGGLVNRLSALWGDLPSPSAAASCGRRAVRDLGEAAGASCRALGIHLDLAPVVDLDRPEGLIPLQGRCFGADPDRVAALARVFNEGLAAWGVAGCLKHFPGLGPVAVDTHDQLPTLAGPDSEEHLAVFAALSEDIPLVMIGHVVVPEVGGMDRPASLSPRAVERAARLPGSPVVISDDLEMGALSGMGSLPDLVVEALRARNHGVLVCKAFDQLPAIVAAIEGAVEEDPSLGARLAVTTSRLGTFARDLLRNAAAVPVPPDETVAQLWERARQSTTPTRP